MQGTLNPAYTLSVSSDRSFLWRVMSLSWLLRLAIIIVYGLTDAIYRLRLSPDSERYHREGIESMTAMMVGDFAYKPWIDDGWFQFTGLVYYLATPEAFMMQLINITLGTALILPVFGIVRNITNDVFVQRFTVVLVAFFPSIVYWSTLMLKDPVSTLAIATIIYGVVELRRRWSVLPVVGIVAALFVLVGVRTYLFSVLIMVIPAAFMLFSPRRSALTLRTFLIPVAMGALPLVFGYGYFASGQLKDSLYFDLDYINHVRVAMGDHGTGAIFDHGEVHIWGVDLADDIWAAARTLFSIFIPVNPLEASSARQLIAIPFVLIMSAFMFPLALGGLELWRARRRAWPVIIIVVVVLGVYIGGTTNAGALFRWTTQIMPYFLMAIAMVAFKTPGSLLGRLSTGAVLLFSAPRRVDPYRDL